MINRMGIETTWEGETIERAKTMSMEKTRATVLDKIIHYLSKMTDTSHRNWNMKHGDKNNETAHYGDVK